MKTIVGDLWSFAGYFPYRMICVPTNGIIQLNGCLVMGAGVALQALDKFNDIDKILGKWVRKHGNIPCVDTINSLISFPTKNDYRDKSDLKLICRSAVQIQWAASYLGIHNVYLPLVGCGLGGLEPSVVAAQLQRLLDDRFTMVLNEQRI